MNEWTWLLTIVGTGKLNRSHQGFLSNPELPPKPPLSPYCLALSVNNNFSHSTSKSYYYFLLPYGVHI
jgi:hypothetical protein